MLSKPCVISWPIMAPMPPKFCAMLYDALKKGGCRPRPHTHTRTHARTHARPPAPRHRTVGRCGLCARELVRVYGRARAARMRVHACIGARTRVLGRVCACTHDSGARLHDAGGDEEPYPSHGLVWLLGSVH